MIKLSICIIFHNQLRYVDRILNSIRSQKLPFQYEILLGDDASTDGTWEKLNDIAESFSNIHCYQVNSSNFNPDETTDRSGVNRWNVYQHITGEYFSFIDADDYYINNERFVKQIELLDNNPDCSICSANVALYKEGDPPSFLNLMYSETLFHTGQKFDSSFFLNGFFHNSSCIIRKPNEDFSSKYSPFLFDDYTLTLMHIGEDKIIYLNEVVFAYIQQENSIYSKYSKFEKYLRSICRTPKTIQGFKEYKNHFKAYFIDTMKYELIDKNNNISQQTYELCKQTIPRAAKFLFSNSVISSIKKYCFFLFYLPIQIFNKIRKGDYIDYKSVIYNLFFK